MPELHGGGERALAARPRLRDSGGIRVQKALHALEVAQSGRDHQVMGGSALEEQPGGLDVSANAPEPAGPQRQIDRLEVGGGIAVLGAGAGAVEGMDVGAPIQQERDHLARRRRHRPVERRAPRAVAAAHELRLGVEECAHARCITDVGREVDRMIGIGGQGDGRGGRGALRAARRPLRDPGPGRR